jgi:hypothetical protein
VSDKPGAAERIVVDPAPLWVQDAKMLGGAHYEYSLACASADQIIADYNYRLALSIRRSSAVIVKRRSFVANWRHFGRCSDDAPGRSQTHPCKTHEIKEIFSCIS